MGKENGRWGAREEMEMVKIWKMDLKCESYVTFLFIHVNYGQGLHSLWKPMGHMIKKYSNERTRVTTWGMGPNGIYMRSVFRLSGYSSTKYA